LRDGGNDAATDSAAELAAAELDAGAELDAAELDAAELDAATLDAAELDAAADSSTDAGDAATINACGGSGELDHEPGARCPNVLGGFCAAAPSIDCATAATWRCEGTEDVVCDCHCPPPP
jgi:hypothetical protein